MSSVEYEFGHLFGKENEDAIKIMQNWIRSNFGLTQGNHLLRSLTKQFTKLVVHEALIQSRGNKSKAARLLGIARPTLAKKILG